MSRSMPNPKRVVYSDWLPVLHDPCKRSGAAGEAAPSSPWQKLSLPKTESDSKRLSFFFTRFRTFLPRAARSP
jgi:hypothetical protein